LVIVSRLASLPAMFPATLLYGQPVTTPLPQPAAAKGTGLPWVELTARPWIVRMSGDIVARESGAPSAMMGPLRFREDLALSGAYLFYEGTLAIHVTPHNMLVADVLLGSASGTAQLTSDSPFDDVTFTAGERARADVSLRTWGLGYRRRLAPPHLGC
jgi:hypothetical protein